MVSSKGRRKFVERRTFAEYTEIIHGEYKNCDEGKHIFMKKILIVDDEMFMRYLLTQALKDDMFELFEAKNGQEALEEGARISPDLMILDVKMDGLDGFEVAARFKKTNPKCSIILLTAESDIRERFELNKENVDHLIHKPCDLESLSEMVKNILA